MLLALILRFHILTPEMITSLIEFIRILKPNGILALVVPNEVIYPHHCLETNQQYNSHHNIDNMDANYFENTFKLMGLNFEVLYKKRT